MKNLATEIFRQRLLIEGFYTAEMNEKTIADYFSEITLKLGLLTYGKPIIHSTGGQGKEKNQGYDAFVPLVDSGISIYVWTNSKFLSVIIYTCKKFEETKAIGATKGFFKMGKIAHALF